MDSRTLEALMLTANRRGMVVLLTLRNGMEGKKSGHTLTLVDDPRLSSRAS